MMVNRIANLLKGTSVGEGASPHCQGFTVNPFVTSNPSWQMQIYQAAFMQAQKTIEEEKNQDWPMAEWWN